MIHDECEDCSLVDYNRSGVPLIEIVSEPDMRSAEEVIAYLEKLRMLIQYLGASDCKLNEGSMRADVNLSIREVGAKEYGTRTEMKNLNSFRSITHAIEAERERQIELLESGHAVVQETRRWDENREESYAMNVPFVCCSYANPYGTLLRESYSSVSIADGEEAYRAVQTLYDNGHRRIAALISRQDDHSIGQLRYQGYVKALERNGLALEEELVISAGSYDIHSAYKAVEEKLRQGAEFTALFAISDNMAIGAMRALREAGRNVPRDCSVIAIDGLEVSEYIDPPLTTLCQPMEEMGERSVDILLDMVQGEGHNRHEILPTTFRKGASVRNIN